ncbi:phosphoenolpyruvate carboxylase, partial [Streptococcus pneumoniae BS455]
MTQEYRTLRNNISMLGRFLGETINDAQGADILELIENIRKLSRNSRA